MFYKINNFITDNGIDYKGINLSDVISSSIICYNDIYIFNSIKEYNHIDLVELNELEYQLETEKFNRYKNDNLSDVEKLQRQVEELTVTINTLVGGV